MEFSVLWGYISFSVALMMRVSTSFGDQAVALARNSTRDAYTITREHRRLRGHSIKTFSSPSLISCGLQCVRNPRCVSTNFKVGTSNKGGECELNDHGVSSPTDEEGLEHVQGVVYTQYHIENDCQLTGCFNGGSCTFDKDSKTFQCNCQEYWTGKQCEEEGTFDLRFTRSSIDDYVIHDGLNVTDAFTICFRMRTTDTSSGDRTVVSYSDSQSTNEVLINKYAQFQLWINNQRRTTQVSANDGNWHQICATWENQAGSWKLYKDGVEETSGTGLKAGHVIKTNGILVIGQEQDSHGGGFDATQNFIGDLTDLNIWNKVLPAQDILSLSNFCHGGRGNVKQWSDFKAGVRGAVEMVTPSTC